jgi:N-acetyl sugar amidotransferase
MKKIYYPNKIELLNFKKDINSPTVKYGLPKNIVYCKKCVISNQRPNSVVEFLNTIDKPKKTINFDQNGICDACNFSVKKNQFIDWDHREKELVDLCDKFRRNDGTYDCIVPGSGGKDSFYASHILKNKFRMNPLTVTWAPHIYTDWGWRNFNRWIHSGNDNYLMTPNGRVHRLLTRLATEILFHPFQPFMLGQKLLAPKMANLFKIPLVFYGENEAEYGNPISDTEVSTRQKNYFSQQNKDLYLGGVHVDDLVKKFGITKNELTPYLPLDEKIVDKEKIEIHYLGYYLKWHPQSCYYYSVEHGGFEASPVRTPGTYSKYNSIDDKIDDLHYYTTAIKYGIGRASYDAAQEIRSGDIDREEGISLVKKYDHEFPSRFIDELFKYLSITPKEFPKASKMFEQPIMDYNYFEVLTNNFRSPHIWCYEKKKDNKNFWFLRNQIN